MFDFHNLVVYEKIRKLNHDLKDVLRRIRDRHFKDQLARASLSIQLNVAEGSGRLGKKDKRRFYIISRASLYECVSLMDSVYDSKIISETEYKEFYLKYEEISKMLFMLIKRLEE